MLKLTMTDSPSNSAAGWYDKYGVYGIKGMPPVEAVSQAEWKNIRFYRQP